MLSRHKVALVIFVIGSLASSLVLVDYILKGMTITQAVFAALAWVTAIYLFFLGFRIFFGDR